jgi:hypothetical protein
MEQNSALSVSSFYYPYQKDERALPGYLLTRCSFSPSDINRLSLSPRCFLFTYNLILTSSLPFYPYQKDERALPGYLLTRCSFPPSDINRLSLSPRCFLFTSNLILSFLTLSLSRLKRVTESRNMFSHFIFLRRVH